MRLCAAADGLQLQYNVYRFYRFMRISEGIMASQKINPKECPQFLNEFFTFQRVVKIKSERTLESYYIDLRIFLRYVKLTKGNIRADMPMRDITISDVPLEWVRDFSKLDILNYLSYVVTDDGRLYCKLGCRSEESALRWFLSFGSKAEILSPEPFRQAFNNELRRTLKIYENT